MMHSESDGEVDYGPKANIAPGQTLGMKIRGELWREVLRVLFTRRGTLNQTMVLLDGITMAKLKLRPLRVDQTYDEGSFLAEMEVVEVLWKGAVQ